MLKLEEYYQKSCCKLKALGVEILFSETPPHFIVKRIDILPIERGFGFFFVEKKTCMTLNDFSGNQIVSPLHTIY